MIDWNKLFILKLNKNTTLFLKYYKICIFNHFAKVKSSTNHKCREEVLQSFLLSLLLSLCSRFSFQNWFYLQFVEIKTNLCKCYFLMVLRISVRDRKINSLNVWAITTAILWQTLSISLKLSKNHLKLPKLYMYQLVYFEFNYLNIFSNPEHYFY